MIYLDTSVLLAWILAEDRTPPASLFSKDLISSRLLQYESWTRMFALGLAKSHGELLSDALTQIAFIELHPHVLDRVLEPFPHSARTLDAIHLASALYIIKNGKKITFASYDERQIQIAKALHIPIEKL